MEDVTPSDISMRHETGDRLQQRIAPAHTYESIDEIVIGTSDHLRCQTGKSYPWILATHLSHDMQHVITYPHLDFHMAHVIT